MLLKKNKKNEVKKVKEEAKKDINVTVVEKKTKNDNDTSLSLVKVGLSIKATRNLGNYESLSANAWAEKYVKEGEEEAAYKEIAEMLKEVLGENVDVPF